jgi:olefin beta-lactone synthetase
MDASTILRQPLACSVNVAARLSAMAGVMPNATAVAELDPKRRSAESQFDLAQRQTHRYRTVSFQWLEADSSTIAAGLIELGLAPGMRIALLVRPGIDFISLVFALLKAGAVQVLIDPGMGKRNVLRALSEARPQGIVGSATVQTLRMFSRKKLADARINVTVGSRWSWNATTLDDVRRRGTRVESFKIAEAHATTPAAIIFTSGSTGPAKGVLYRHGNFDRQVTEIRDFYKIEPGEIDVPCFPLFGLFNAAMGVTSVIPAIDTSRPAAADPRAVISAIDDWQATQSFGSPAIWNRVGQYCEARGVRMNSLRRVLSAGAPVAAHVLKRMIRCIHPEGEMHTPYGATEALPVASISSTEVVSETVRQTDLGAGVCVGRCFGGIEWRVVGIQDGPIPTIDDAAEIPQGEIGELIVRGPVVTTEYVTRTSANSMAKICDDSGGFWHRMGDVGYFDQQNRFWFCGRMSQRVRSTTGRGNAKDLFTIPCEAIFNTHPAVSRSALVGVGPSPNRRPVVVIEPIPEKRPRNRRTRNRLFAELRSLGQTAPHTAAIGDFLLRNSLPVDVRHNVKINREQLAQWAARQLKVSTP